MFLLISCPPVQALGLLAGIRWPRLGIAAAIGVVIYFVGAIISHLLVGDVAGLGSPVFMLAIAGTLLALRMRTRRPSSGSR